MYIDPIGRPYTKIYIYILLRYNTLYKIPYTKIYIYYYKDLIYIYIYRCKSFCKTKLIVKKTNLIAKTTNLIAKRTNLIAKTMN